MPYKLSYLVPNGYWEKRANVIASAQYLPSDLWLKPLAMVAFVNFWIYVLKHYYLFKTKLYRKFLEKVKLMP